MQIVNYADDLADEALIEFNRQRKNLLAEDGRNRTATGHQREENEATGHRVDIVKTAASDFGKTCGRCSSHRHW